MRLLIRIFSLVVALVPMGWCTKSNQSAVDVLSYTKRVDGGNLLIFSQAKNPGADP